MLDQRPSARTRLLLSQRHQPQTVNHTWGSVSGLRIALA